MRLTIFYTLTAILMALPAFAQRHRGGGHGGQGFNGGGNNAPSTFITKTSAAPAASSAAASNSGAGTGTGSVDAALIPPFGITAGIKAPDGTANCVGDNGKDIPCDCPPDLNTFTKAVQVQVAAGQKFPTSNSIADQLTRLQTCVVALQNFKGGPGSGVGCPAVSTTWNELRTKLQSEQ